MDSTVIQQECIDELGDVLGIREAIARVTEKAMMGQIGFEESLRERVALLRGADASTAIARVRRRITHSPGARCLIATMKHLGAYTCLVSGGFTVFAEPVGNEVGFDEVHANVLLTDDDQRFTGQVRVPILGRAFKRQVLESTAQRLGVDTAATLAVGDGANDLDMLAAAGLGVAYRAKPVVARAAAARVTHSDLRALLYFQGIKQDEFKE